MRSAAALSDMSCVYLYDGVGVVVVWRRWSLISARSALSSESAPIAALSAATLGARPASIIVYGGMNGAQA